MPISTWILTVIHQRDVSFILCQRKFPMNFWLLVLWQLINKLNHYTEQNMMPLGLRLLGDLNKQFLFFFFTKCAELSRVFPRTDKLLFNKKHNTFNMQWFQTRKGIHKKHNTFNMQWFQTRKGIQCTPQHTSSCS